MSQPKRKESPWALLPVQRCTHARSDYVCGSASTFAVAARARMGLRMQPVTKPGKTRPEEDELSFSYDPGLELDFLRIAKKCREFFSSFRNGRVRVDILGGSGGKQACASHPLRLQSRWQKQPTEGTGIARQSRNHNAPSSR